MRGGARSGAGDAAGAGDAGEAGDAGDAAADLSEALRCRVGGGGGGRGKWSVSSCRLLSDPLDGLCLAAMARRAEKDHCEPACSSPEGGRAPYSQRLRPPPGMVASESSSSSSSSVEPLELPESESLLEGQQSMRVRGEPPVDSSSAVYQSKRAIRKQRRGRCSDCPEVVNSLQPVSIAASAMTGPRTKAAKAPGDWSGLCSEEEMLWVLLAPPCTTEVDSSPGFQSGAWCMCRLDCGAGPGARGGIGQASSVVVGVGPAGSSVVEVGGGPALGAVVEVGGGGGTGKSVPSRISVVLSL